MLRNLRIQNFRCFRDHTVRFEGTTVVVGKNNAGKSSLIEALQLLAAVVNRRGRNFVPAPRWLELPRFRLCVTPRVSHLGLNLTTAFHRYEAPPAEIEATFAGGVVVTAYIGAEDTFYATVKTSKDWVTTSSQFLQLDIPPLFVLPQISPVLTDEFLRSDVHIEDNLFSRLASRHFRNQIVRMPDQFVHFKSLAETTWAGLRVDKVEQTRTKEGVRLTMQVREGDFVAEVG